MNNKNFIFTFENLKGQFLKAKDLGYQIISCEEFARNKPSKDTLTIVNRVDVDFSVKKAARLHKMFNELSIPATFFFRLHAPEYNPLSFENYKIIRNLHRDGYEIGYHSEIIDQEAIWSESASLCLERDIRVFKDYFDIEIKGIASHGGMTGLNNLDFWKKNKPKDFNLLYEAYDTEPDFNLFNNSLYISDSEWTRWKSYKNGINVEGDHRSFGEHLDDKPNLIYLLIHSDTYYDQHFYE